MGGWTKPAAALALLRVLLLCCFAKLQPSVAQGPACPILGTGAPVINLTSGDDSIDVPDTGGPANNRIFYLAPGTYTIRAGTRFAVAFINTDQTICIIGQGSSPTDVVVKPIAANNRHAFMNPLGVLYLQKLTMDGGGLVQTKKLIHQNFESPAGRSIYLWCAEMDCSECSQLLPAPRISSRSASNVSKSASPILGRHLGRYYHNNTMINKAPHAHIDLFWPGWQPGQPMMAPDGRGGRYRPTHDGPRWPRRSIQAAGTWTDTPQQPSVCVSLRETHVGPLGCLLGIDTQS